MRTTKDVAEGTAASGSARAAWWVGAGIFLSRVAGYVRDAVLAAYLGTSRTADIWYLGLRTPNIIQYLLGEGTLSASFIPVYASFLEEGREEEAGHFAGAALGLVATLAYGIALVGMLLAPILIPVVFFELEPEYQRLLITVVRILLPMTATMAVSAWALGVLNTHRRFFISYVAPVAWNLAIIAAAVAAGSFMGLRGAGRDADLVVMVAWGALVGGVLQLGVQVPFLWPLLGHFRLSVSTRVAGVREAIRNFLPVVAARGVVNLSALLDAFLAALLVEGAVTSLARAQTLYVLPISLFGTAVAASELPELSRQHRAESHLLAARVRAALERVSFFLVPSAVAYLAFGDVLVEALYQRGAFGAADTRVVWAVLAAYALGLLASGSSRTLSSAYFAMRDTGTPARVATLRVFVSLAIGAVLMFPLDRYGVGDLHFGAAGLALGASVGAWLEYGLLRSRLKGRLGAHGARPGHLARLLLAAAVGVAVALAFRTWLEAPVRGLAPDRLAGPLAAAGTAGCFGVAYLAVAHALGVSVGLRRLLRR